MKGTYLAQSCTTNSKREQCYAVKGLGLSIDPLEESRIGEGTVVFNNGKYTKYIDTVCGLGSQVNGWYHNPCIQSKTSEQLAEALGKRFGYPKVKITQSGSDACSCAVRIARAITGKHVILQSGYHGDHDWTVSNKEPSSKHAGQQKTRDFATPMDIIKYLKYGKKKKDIACAIVEPIQLDTSWVKCLPDLKRICAEQKIMLIFDETITAYRVPLGSVSNWTGVKPDMLVLGKALGNGLPINCVLGGTFMDSDNYFWSNTHAGNDTCCMEGLKTNNWITEDKIMRLWDLGANIMAKVNHLLRNCGVRLSGYNTRGEWQGKEADLTRFWDFMGMRGYLLGRAFFLNYSLAKEDIEEFIVAVRHVAHKIESGAVSKVKPVSFSFRRN